MIASPGEIVGWGKQAESKQRSERIVTVYGLG
jgi:hypothetical protein